MLTVWQQDMLLENNDNIFFSTLFCCVFRFFLTTARENLFFSRIRSYYAVFLASLIKWYFIFLVPSRCHLMLYLVCFRTHLIANNQSQVREKCPFVCFATTIILAYKVQFKINLFFFFYIFLKCRITKYIKLHYIFI